MTFIVEGDFAHSRRRARFVVFDRKPLRPLAHRAVAAPPLPEGQIRVGFGAPALARLRRLAHALEARGYG
ncbi:MAG: hypothetical protein WB663_03655, partial [Beijerinckiaceae bacterium]